MLEVAVQRRLGAFQLDMAFTGAARGATVLFGPSGAGKSSLLAAVAGALKPEGGRVAVGGRLLFDSGAGVDLPMEQRRIGWCAQEPRLFPTMPVRANLLYGARRARRRAERVSFADVTDALQIGALLPRRVRDLSGGERQRVALGRALLSQPDLLLLDEPLSALDASRRADALALIEGVRDRFGLPMLYVTHNLDEALRLAEQLVLVDEGRVIAAGAPAETLAAAGVVGGARTIVGRVTGLCPEGIDTAFQADERRYLLPRLAVPSGSLTAVTLAAHVISSPKETAS